MKNWRFLLLNTIILLAILFLGPARIFAREVESGRGYPPVQASTPLALASSQDQYPVGLHLEILEDQEKVWTIEDVTSPDISQQFIPSQSEAPSFGFTNSAFWVRFRAQDLADEPVRWLLSVDSNLFFIDVYVPASIPDKYQVTKTGTALPFNTREIEHPRFLFNLPLSPGEEAIIYLRLESESSLNFPMTVWTAEAVAQDDLVQQVLNGFIYGVLVIMAGYNLIIFLYLKDRSYLYYVLFLFFLLMSFLVDDGIAHQYLWPGTGRFNAIGGQLFFVLVIMSALKFTTAFLHTKEETPRLHRVFILVIIAYVVLLPILLIDLRISARPNLVLTVISFILIISTGVIFWRRGYHPARYFLLAWVLLIVSLLIFVISLFAFQSIGIIGEAGSQIGIVVLTLGLSLALADRISIYRQDKERAQEELLRQQTEFTASLQQSNLELEAQFEERTQELSFAQEQLDSLFKNSTLAFGTAAMTGRVLTANQAMKSILGYPDDEIFEANVLDFFADDVLREEIMGQLVADKYVRAPMVQLRKKDGSLFYANITESILSRKDQDVLLGIVDDITDQVLAEQELLKQSEEAAIEAERTRIARDLHDSVSQGLYAASLIAETLPDVYQGDPVKGQAGLDELRRLTQSSQAEMRTLLIELYPAQLTERPLNELIKQLADTAASHSDLEITTSISGECNLPDEVQVAFYRIGQEALTNVSKHAQARRIWIHLRCLPDGASLRIRDDGRGYSAGADQPYGLGLNSMQERARGIQAEISITSQPGEGTQVRVEWQQE